MSIYWYKKQRQNHDTQLSFNALHQIIRSFHESVTQGTLENNDRLDFLYK